MSPAPSSDLANSVAEGAVYLWLSVEVAEDITADQLAAITTHYRDELRTVDYTDYQTEFDVRRDWNVFTVDSDTRPVTNGDQITEQARRWVASPNPQRHHHLPHHRHPPTSQPHPNDGPPRQTPPRIRPPQHRCHRTARARHYTAVAATATALATRLPT